MFDKIEKYGLTLTRLKEEHLETIRIWRNSVYVRNKMIFQQEISPEMHSRWFETINNDFNYYYLVEYKNEQVGVANIKDIKDGAGEPGFYLSKQEYEDTGISALVSVALGELGFNSLGLNQLYIHVLKNNDRALKYNLFLGYNIIEDRSTNEVLFLKLDRDTFNQKIKKLKNYLLNIK